VGTILTVGHDDALLVTRAALLRTTPATVVAAKAQEALKLLKEKQFDLVILCHTLSPEEMIAVASLAHHQQIGTRVLKLVSGEFVGVPTNSVAADDEAICEPKSLVAKVSEMLTL
jgi:CheY-like chemotaxis protein